jgi:predicted Zn-dependent protease
LKCCLSFQRLGWLLPAGLFLALAVRGELPEWIRGLESGDRLEGVFFRSMDLPAGAVTARRPPRETRAELTTRIGANPQRAELYSLRAREAELSLDFDAAESDWKRYAELASNKAAALIDLADYYHRRLKVEDEFQALAAAAQESSPARERFTPPSEQTSWRLFERMLELADRQLLPWHIRDGVYRQWAQRYPDQHFVAQRRVRLAIASRQFADAEKLLEDYARQYASDNVFAVSARADLETKRGNAGQALAVYDRSFDPLWPQPLINSYFTLLRETRTLREFLNKARAAAASDPMALDPVARQFHFHLQEGNPGLARRVLLEYRQRKESRKGVWTDRELFTLARLFEQQGEDPWQACRSYYALYSLPGAQAEMRRDALAGLIQILLHAPGVPLGAGDLTFYRDIGTADPYPGFLNGILSLLLNSADPSLQFANEQRNSVAYFARTKASELISVFERSFPNAPQIPLLHFRLVEAYSLHGETESVLSAGGRFLSRFGNDTRRTQVILLMADAHARRNTVAEEIAAYDSLLVELARRSGGAPLGEGVIPQTPGTTGAKGARSPEYVRVLDRYLSRLAALRRPKDALAVLSKEVDRNPEDPGLYERLAAFFDQNKLAADVEATYRRAMGRFPEASWRHKLARFYLRQKQSARFRELTAEVTRIFTGTELETYFRQVIGSANLDAALYLQVNLAAHQRFPASLVFVENLLRAYQNPATSNPAAWEALLRRYWFYDDGLRSRFFEFLSRTGRLGAELRALEAAGAPAHPAAARMLGEAQVWRAHFEEAAAPLVALTKEAPGDREVGERAASLCRSLAAYNAARAVEAAAIEANLSRAAPRDAGPLTRGGEIAMEYPKSGSAEALWSRIPQIDPGSSDGYLEAATLYWDYFRYDDALRMMDAGRKRLGQPALFAYEAGAIHENKRQYEPAIREYIAGALANPGGSQAQARLLRLARRPAHRAFINGLTAQLAAPQTATQQSLSLRIALLEQQARKEDLEAELLNLASQTASYEMLVRVQQEGARLELAAVEDRALLRRIELSPDPVDKLRMRLELARLYEQRRNLTSASAAINALYRENPMTLGIVRAAVNYHWRHRNSGRALDILTASINAAHVSLKPQLRFEAARKATESARYDTAREHLNALLVDDPYNPSYLGAMADTYARQGDERTLRSFYLEKIATLANANIPPPERLQRVAALRRALAGVLVRSGDAAGAIDQYMEVLNRYAEDTALLDEIAGLARRTSQQQRVLAYYQKAAAASPKDFRWPLILARIYTSFEDYPSAIAEYGKAVAIRPDRLDLMAARGGLQERLLRFDDAAATFTKAYELSYRNPEWMRRVAEIRARQGRSGDCVAALRAAFIEARGETPDSLFAMAAHLESWRLLPQAREFAARGAALAGDKLLEAYRAEAEIYVRVLTKLLDFEAALAVAPRGELLLSMAAAATNLSGADQARFAEFLEQHKDVAGPEIGQMAGLAGWEVRRRHEVILANIAEAQGHIERLRELQGKRLAFEELGGQLETYFKAMAPGDERAALLDYAAEAYRSAGNEAAELRVRAQLGASDPRYFELLARRNPQRLIQLSAGSETAANAAVASGNASLALSAIRARGRAYPPVWTQGFTALAGLYFNLRTPEIDAAFQSALGPPVIGQRVGTASNRGERLAGNTWYYFGARYGEYLNLLGRPEFDDYLPSFVEASPGRAAAYFELGEYYRASGRTQQAMECFDLALQLDGAHFDSIERTARILAGQGKVEEAAARYKHAIDTLASSLAQPRGGGAAPVQIAALFHELPQAKLFTPLRAELDRLLAAYVRRYGSYQTEPLLETLVAHSTSRAEGIGRIVALSRQTPNSVEFLEPLLKASWIRQEDKEPIFTEILQASAVLAAGAIGDARDFLTGRQHHFLAEWIRYLLESKQSARAQATLASLPQESRTRLSWLAAEVEVHAAVESGRLGELIERYRASGPGPPPPCSIVRPMGAPLRRRGDAASFQPFQRFCYETELERNRTIAANYLGLAEVLLESGDAGEAVRQLRRMSLAAEPAFVNLADAGRLLARFRRTADAIQFLEMAVKSTPWDAGARRALEEVRTPRPAPEPRPLNTLIADAAVRPDDPQIKLAVFRAARAAGRHLLAANAIESIMRRGPLEMLFRYERHEEHFEPVAYWAETFLAGLGLADSERAQAALDLADSLSRSGRTGGAIVALKTARMIAPGVEVQAALGRMEAELERRRRNEQRAPKLAPNLDQEHLVRPMLTAQGGGQ